MFLQKKKFSILKKKKRNINMFSLMKLMKLIPTFLYILKSGSSNCSSLQDYQNIKEKFSIIKKVQFTKKIKFFIKGLIVHNMYAIYAQYVQKIFDVHMCTLYTWILHTINDNILIITLFESYF